VDLLLAPFSNMPASLVAFVVAIGITTVMIGIILRAAVSTEGGRRWVRAVTNPNAKILFTVLFIGWAIFFGVTLNLVPHVGASSPYGALGLIALFTGFFIMMGLLWAVIGE
jgi:hypothetical protein